MGLGIPATPPGVVNPDHRTPRKVGLQAQGRWQTVIDGGAALHVEPRLASGTSLPVTVSGGLHSGLQSRVGVRHFAHRLLVLGGGVGVSAWYHDWPPGTRTALPPYVAGVFDLELGFAGRLDWFGTTFVVRPCLGVYDRRLSQGVGLWGYLEVRHAWLFYVGKKAAITVRFELGVGNDPTDETRFAESERFAGERQFFFGMSLGVLIML